jgi:hypothetical protein
VVVVALVLLHQLVVVLRTGVVVVANPVVTQMPASQPLTTAGRYVEVVVEVVVVPQLTLVTVQLVVVQRLQLQRRVQMAPTRQNCHLAVLAVVVVAHLS